MEQWYVHFRFTFPCGINVLKTPLGRCDAMKWGDVCHNPTKNLLVLKTVSGESFHVAQKKEAS